MLLQSTTRYAKNFSVSKKEQDNYVSIQIPPELNVLLDEFCGKRMKKRVVVADIIGWFLAEPGYVQKMILRDTPDMTGAYIDMLERLIEEVRNAPLSLPHGSGGSITSKAAKPDKDPPKPKP